LGGVLRLWSVADENGLWGRDAIGATWARGDVFASSPAIGTCLFNCVTIGRAVRVATTSKKFFIGFRLVNTPCLGNGVNLFFRRFGVISAVISGGWGGARKLRRVRMVVGKSRSNGIRAILIVSVAGSDLFIFGVDGGPSVHRGLGAMPVARWSASIEWSIVVEHYANDWSEKGW